MTEKFPTFKRNLEISAKSELKLRNAVNNIANKWFISSQYNCNTQWIIVLKFGTEITSLLLIKELLF